MRKMIISNETAQIIFLYSANVNIVRKRGRSSEGAKKEVDHWKKSRARTPKKVKNSESVPYEI